MSKLSLAGEASAKLAAELTSINTSLIAEKGKITSAGILDVSTVSELVKTATMQAASDILKLETNFGTTFAEALSNYIPEPSLMAGLIADRVVELSQLTAGAIQAPQVISQQPINLTLVIDSEQIVTPGFAEQVSDQLSINAQSGAAWR